MRISKLMSAVLAAAFLAGVLAVRAQDNPDQAAARAALMRKLGEPNAQPAPPATQTMAPANKPMTPAAPAPMEMQTAPSPAVAGDTPAQAAARAALMQKMGASNAQQPPPASSSLAPMVMKPSATAVQSPEQRPKPAPMPTAPVTPKPAAVKPAPVAAAVPSAGSSDFFTPVPPPSNPPIPAGALPVVSSTPPPAKPVAPVAVPVTKPAPPAAPVPVPLASPTKPPANNVNYAGKSLGFAPIEAPPPPVSAQKQAQLQALLSRYMANQISPEEYQKERAAIMDQP